MKKQARPVPPQSSPPPTESPTNGAPTVAELLIHQVRDEVLDRCYAAINGPGDEHAAGPPEPELAALVDWTTKEQRQALKTFVREAVDETLHRLLVSWNGNRDRYLAALQEQELSAEQLFGSEGWIARHSRFDGGLATAHCEVLPARTAQLEQLCFSINELTPNDKGILLRGRCGEAEIAVGDTIEVIGKAPVDGSTSLEALPLDFIVDGIYAYGRSLDYLCCGMNGELQLVSRNEDDLAFFLVATGRSRGRPGLVAPYQRRYEQKKVGPERDED